MATKPPPRNYLSSREPMNKRCADWDESRILLRPPQRPDVRASFTRSKAEALSPLAPAEGFCLAWCLLLINDDSKETR